MMQVIHAQTIEPTSVTSDYIICFVCGHLWELKFAQWQIKLPKSSENVAKYTINPFKMAKVLNVVPSWWNFTKSGHTEVHSVLHDWSHYIVKMGSLHPIYLILIFFSRRI